MNSIPAEENLAILGIVADAIGNLRDSLVFVGGCATGLLVTDVRAQPIRATIDVDLIAQVASRSEYAALEREFEALGFAHDLSKDAPICRWKKTDVIVDLMPTDAAILGFHNRWYPFAVESAQKLVLQDGLAIKLISAPAFIATKLEAFKGRGNNDYLLSHDLEDIVTVIDGRETLHAEISKTDTVLKNYVAFEFSELLRNPYFNEALQGHLPADRASQQRLPRLRQRLRALAELAVP